MFIYIVVILPITLLANKEEIRSIYPLIWEELKENGYKYTCREETDEKETQLIAQAKEPKLPNFALPNI